MSDHLVVAVAFAVTWGWPLVAVALAVLAVPTTGGFVVLAAMAAATVTVCAAVALATTNRKGNPHD